jgi:peptide/nickel transport system ATP-binding protein
MSSKGQSREAGAGSKEDVVLSVGNANVSYDMDRGEARVLDDVSLEVRRGEILGIVGESGSGKSMFASALLDAAPPPGRTTGDIVFHPPGHGKPVDVLDLSEDDLRQFRWEQVSMVFQGAMSSFNPTMTIRGHFEETIRAHGMDLAEQMVYGRQLLEDLYLDPDRVLDAYPHEISGGMQQRALIALSLLLEPEVLVMDEPTAALDLLMQRSITNMLSDIREEYGITILFITHDLPLLTGLVDRLTVMYAFEFIETGGVEDILLDAAHPYTRQLLGSIPSIDAKIDEMEPIPGRSPDPVSAPAGCPYHPRCPVGDSRCEESDPEMRPVGEGHAGKCFYPDDSRDQVSYTLSEYEEFGELGTDDGRAHHSRSGDPVVSLRDVEVHFDTEGAMFGDDEVVKAVDGVDLDVHESDVVALVGESGCGKTTLGKTAVGLQRPTGGAVEYRGQDVWDAHDGASNVAIPYERIRKGLQIIHQDPGSSLNPNKTVKGNLAVPLKRHRTDLGPSQRETIIVRLLERLGIDPPRDYAARYPHQLSGGEQQRVVLGRSMLMQPDLVLADEAVSALDVSLRVEMMDLMLELQDLTETSYLFISHDFANARYLAKKADGRIGVMYLGELVEIGPVDEVLRNPKHPYTKLLIWSAPPIDPERSKAEQDVDPPVRGVDIPDPKDPPSGCRFHTRCERVIPPADGNLEQAAFNEIISFRQAIADRDLDVRGIASRLGTGAIDPVADAEAVDPDEFARALYRQHFDTELPDRDRERILEAGRAIAGDDYRTASNLLADAYTSVCERESPTLSSGHGVACHLYDETLAPTDTSE